MKFFDYETIYLAARGDSSKILQFFKEMPSVGKSFILNESIVSRNFMLPDRVLAEYLGLCSLRNYSEYLMTGNKDLEISQLPPWVPIQVAKNNPLIKITDKQIVFIKETK